MTDATKWKVLSFRDSHDVPGASLEERSAHIRARATEKFGLASSDFNPDDPPAYPGTMPLRNIENGGVTTFHVFEVQISAAAAEKLSFEYHPEILLVSDAVQRRSPPLGANDPRQLPKGPKIKF